MAEKDYYAILGVKRDASAADIKKAFRTLAKKYHPDRNKGDKKAEQRFKEINEAHNVLTDKEKRAQYDQFGTVRDQGFAGGDFWEQFRGAPRGGRKEESFSWGGAGGGGGLGDIFSQFFRRESPFSGGASGRSGPMRGEDSEVTARVSFDHAVRGGRMTVTVPSAFTCKTCNGSGAQPGTQAQTCPHCHGTGTTQDVQGGFAFSRPCPRCYGRGQIITTPCAACRGSGQVEQTRKFQLRIPKGVRDGQRIRLTGQGQPGRNGGPAGDLFVRIQVTAHPGFQRKGNDIYSEATVNMVQAALGTHLSVKTAAGETVRLRIAPGTQSGSQLRLRGKGIASANGENGDHYVTIGVTVPKAQTEEQKKLLRQFAASAGLAVE